MFTENVHSQLKSWAKNQPGFITRPANGLSSMDTFMISFIIFNHEGALRKMKILKRKRELRVSILKVMGFQHPFLKRNNIEYLRRSHVGTIHDSFSYVCFSHVLLREPRSANTQVGGVFYSKTEGILVYH